MLKKIINRIIKQKDTVSWHKLSNVESEAENFELGYITDNKRRLYTVIISSNDDLSKKALDNLVYQIKMLTNQELITLSNNFRKNSGIEWMTDWSKIDPSKIIQNFENDMQKIVFLGLGTFNPNGYYREKCLNLLVKYNTESLPYIILRQNDWVHSIHNKAFDFSSKILNDLNIKEMYDIIEFVQVTPKQYYRDIDTIDDFYEVYKSKLLSLSKHLEIKDLINLEYHKKRFIYNIILNENILSNSFMYWLFNYERDLNCKKIILRSKSGDSIFSEEFINEMINSKDNFIRRVAIGKKYDKTNNIWPGIEKYLLDEYSSIRKLTRYILEKHTDFDIYNYCKQAYLKEESKECILALGELGNNDDLDLIKNNLNSDDVKIIFSSLVSVTKLSNNLDKELYYKYLLHDNSKISKYCYKIIIRNKLKYDINQVYNDFVIQQSSSIKFYLFRIIENDKSLDGLCSMLEIFNLNDDLYTLKAEKYLSEYWVEYYKPSLDELNRLKELYLKYQNNLSKSINSNLSFLIKTLEK